MDTEQFKKVYENTLKNSVGREKKCAFKKNIKKVVLKVALAALIIWFTLTTLSGCNPHLEENINKYMVESEESQYNGYSIYELSNFESERAQKLLDKYGFDDYTNEGIKRNYTYKVEDYKKIDELDETYLYGMYLNTTDTTLLEILKSLGYESLQDFLIKNNYVDNNGQPNILVWREADLINISEILASENRGVGLK